jgi:elongation of very long chain fatty acids protein 4
VDTVFIIIEGNWRQFTFLHVFHHFTIFAFYWLNTYAGYDGDIWWTIVANGTIHGIMYYYYALTSVGVRPAWKSFVTYAQLVQFVTMMSQAATILVFPAKCPYPRPIAATYFFYILYLFILFVQFAIANYCTPRKSKTA